MSKKFRNPLTGEIIVLEEGDEESVEVPVKPVAKREAPNTKESETAETPPPESGDGAEENPANAPSGRFRTPFDFLDEIDGRDVEKVVLGTVLGIGGVLAAKGLHSVFSRG